MYVCLCMGITDKQVKQAVKDGASSMRDLNKQLGVSSQCGKCGLTAKRLLKECLTTTETTSVFAGPCVEVWRPVVAAPASTNS
ncbi:MAG: bacterioferritin-associated ferredoxin [Pseudomonadota bacterium]